MDLKSDTTYAYGDLNHEFGFGDNFEEIPLFQEQKKAPGSAGGSPVKQDLEPVPRNFDKLMDRIIQRQQEIEQKRNPKTAGSYQDILESQQDDPFLDKSFDSTQVSSSNGSPRQSIDGSPPRNPQSILDLSDQTPATPQFTQSAPEPPSSAEEAIQSEAMEKTKKVWCEFLTDIVAMQVVFYLGQIAMVAYNTEHSVNGFSKISFSSEIQAFMSSQLAEYQDTDCGVPIRLWLQLFFALVAARCQFQLAKVMMNLESTAFNLVRLLCFDGVLFIWLLYGNSLYFSSSNDCSTVDSTRSINMLFVGALCLGYLGAAAYLIIFVTLPFVYLKQRTELIMSQTDRQKETEGLLSSLQQIQFCECSAKGETACAICLQEYQPSDVITQLPCSQMHYFHTSCLKASIRQGNKQCPFCREPIQRPVPVKEEESSPLLGGEDQDWELQEADSLQQVLRFLDEPTVSSFEAGLPEQDPDLEA